MTPRIMPVVVAIAIASGAAAYCNANTMDIPGYAPCYRVDEFRRDLMLTTLKMYMDDKGNAYISTDAAPDCRGFVGAGRIAELQKALDKFPVWSAIATKNSVEVSKDLAAFVTDGEFHKYGVWFRFLADDGGTHSRLVIKIVDFEHEYIEETVVVEAAGVAALGGLLAKRPETMSALKKKTANEALFK